MASWVSLKRIFEGLFESGGFKWIFPIGLEIVRLVLCGEVSVAGD